ncbi:hypothetical protein ACFQ4L_03860 [Lapidilactobacillus mulanensis]|uniref:Uncharacterized protein n=1 Tax=Lapidilactobacillus mulanensis TaxID=2485999 RepID=A0ABW4DMI0_9LACO
MSQNAEEKITDHCEIVLVGLNLIFKSKSEKLITIIVIRKSKVPLERG